MGNAIVTLRIMPESPDTDLEAIKVQATKEIANFGGEVGKELIEPVAFGLKSLSLIFVVDEEKGGTDALEEKIREIEGVNSAEVTDVRRALG